MIKKRIVDPFAAQAKRYALSRPRYPGELVKTVAEKCFPDRFLCLDVACGSGQLTVDLTKYFTKVHGVDKSQAQLDNAPEHPQIKYMCVPNLSLLPSNEYDCLTVAQAFHWMEPKPTLEEFHRLLKPGGVLGVLGYSVCSIVDNDDAQRAFRKYYVDTLGSLLEPSDPKCMWECDRRRLDTAHVTDEFDPLFQNMQWTFTEQRKSVQAHEFIDYLKTQSAYQQIDDGEAALEPIAKALNGRQTTVAFPFCLILGTKAFT